MAMVNLPRQWTVADRDELSDDGNRYEVVDGELFVTPVPTWRHQEAVIALATRLRAYMAVERVGRRVLDHRSERSHPRAIGAGRYPIGDR